MFGEDAGRRVGAVTRHLTPQNTFSPTAISLQATCSPSSSVWTHVAQAPPDAILGITEAFKKDNDRNKINLGVGAYRTEEGKPLVLNVVKKAQHRLLDPADRNLEYLAIGGIPEFCALTAALAFGEKVIYLPKPTWANHSKIFPLAGIEVKTYRYWDSKSCGLDFEGMLEDLHAAPETAIVLLHACAHNPTGVDPTPEQWKQIKQVVQKRHLLPFFDSAYQGFASGDLERDAAPVRLFADAGLEMLLAQSYAKNMGLYGERVGALTVVTADARNAPKVESQLKATIRPFYSSPPRTGAELVVTILKDPELYNEWKSELRGMAERIKSMRAQLRAALQAEQVPGSWDHITNQIGMFSYTGLNTAQSQHLTKESHVYLTMDGRISMAGLNSTGCKYLAKAIARAMKEVQ